MFSVYHFFKDLVSKAPYFYTIQKLEDFPFDTNLLSCQSKGQFPDLAIKITTNDELFSGGEFIELKDSKTYSVASFNSTIPSGKKRIDQVIKSENSLIKRQMESAGDNIYSLIERDVFYLIRGRKKENVKIALIHGSFFETVTADKLISHSFEQVLEERLKKEGVNIDDNIKEILLNILSEQSSFSKVRNVEKASVKLRFRILTEVKAEGNILNSLKYPAIKDNTINFIVPMHTMEEEKINNQCFANVFDAQAIKLFNNFKIKHLLNGYFTVFQISLIDV